MCVDALRQVQLLGRAQACEVSQAIVGGSFKVPSGLQTRMNIGDDHG